MVPAGMGRWLPGLAAVWLAGCSIESGGLRELPGESDAGMSDAAVDAAAMLLDGAAGGDAERARRDAEPAAIDAGTDAGPIPRPDAGESLNLLLTANGGVLESFTSSWCVPTTLHRSECRSGYYLPENVHDGEYAEGNCMEQPRAAWASDDKTRVPGPEELVFSFRDGRDATLASIVVQNFGDEECFVDRYYSGGFEVDLDGVNILAVTLDADTDLQRFDLPSRPTGDELVVRVTSGCSRCDSDVTWELGEVEAWGTLR